jgi:hypothetical protein
MIGVAKTAQDEERNDYGLPFVAAEAPDNRGNFHQHVELNKALPWIAFSWFLSGGAIVGLILLALLLPEVIDSRVAKELAAAKADMHLAETNALLAKDRTDKMAAALEARGLIKLENH